MSPSRRTGIFRLRVVIFLAPGPVWLSVGFGIEYLFRGPDLPWMLIITTGFLVYSAASGIFDSLLSSEVPIRDGTLQSAGWFGIP